MTEKALKELLQLINQLADIKMSYLCNAEGNLRDLILALFTFKCKKCWI